MFQARRFVLAVAALLAIVGWLAAPDARGEGPDGAPTSLILLPFEGDDATRSALAVGKRIFEARVTATGRFRFLGDQETEQLFDDSRAAAGVSPAQQREADLQAARRSYARFALALAIERLDRSQFLVSLQVWDPGTNSLVFTDNEVVADATSVGAAARVGLDALARRFLVSPLVLGLDGPSVAGQGRLDVLDVTPSPVEVLVNGRRVGQAPGQFTGLPVGPAQVELRADGYAPLQRTVELSASEVVSIRAVRLDVTRVRIEVRANLAGATIDIDGQAVGVTRAREPVAIEVIATSRQLRVTRPGYRTVTQPLDLLTSGLRRFDVALDPYTGPDGRSVDTADCQRTNARDGARLCSVPAGEFDMGSATTGSRPDEAPARRVTLSRGFSAYSTEVTVGMYRRCVAAGACKAPGIEVRGTPVETARENAVAPACNYNAPGRDDAPMNCVNWHGAEAYCSWAGGELPTEAQWEFAARGVDGRLLPWGAATDASCMSAHLAECRDAAPGGSTVGELAAGRSPFGLFDTLGNVAEWVRDTYEGGAYATLPATDPISDAAISRRVVRGGSAQDFFGSVRTTSRSRLDANARAAHVGFRCVVEAP